jgi:putative phosphoribosyl transferase
VVDDGAATGSTLIAALHAVRARGPARIVCALPVASREAVTAIKPLVDELVCLAVPEPFGAVGAFFRSFPQLDDDQAIRLLAD